MARESALIYFSKIDEWRWKPMASEIKKPTGKVTITPRDLMGDDLYLALENILRQHLRNTNNLPGPGEYPALLFGASDSGLVTRVRLMNGDN